MKKTKSHYVGMGDRFPNAAERRALNDYCEHEGLHKACAECTVVINQFIELMAPIIKDRGATYQALTNCR